MTWDDPEENDTPIYLGFTRGSTKVWHFVPAGAGYELKTGGGRCLNVQGGADVGNRLILFRCEGAQNDTGLPAWQPATPAGWGPSGGFRRSYR